MQHKDKWNAILQQMKELKKIAANNFEELIKNSKKVAAKNDFKNDKAAAKYYKQLQKKEK